MYCAFGRELLGGWFFSLFVFPNDSFCTTTQRFVFFPKMNCTEKLSNANCISLSLPLSRSFSLFIAALLFLSKNLRLAIVCRNGDVWAAEMFGDSKHHKTLQRARKRSFYHERFVSNKRQPSAGLKKRIFTLDLPHLTRASISIFGSELRNICTRMSEACVGA